MYSGRNLFLHVFSQLSCTPAGCAVAFAVRKRRNAKCKAASYFQKYYHPSRGREFVPCCKMALAFAGRKHRNAKCKAASYFQKYYRPSRGREFVPCCKMARTRHFKESKARLYERSWKQQVLLQERSPDSGFGGYSYGLVIGNSSRGHMV